MGGSPNTAFVMTLVYSGAKHIRLVNRCDLKSLERCAQCIPLLVARTDNMKTVVGREEGKVLWNKRFEDFAAEMGAVSKVCPGRKPQIKGKVARLVRYVKENSFPGGGFRDLA